MVCQTCGAVGPTKYTDLHRHIGMIIMMQHSSIQGNLCKVCIHKYFWEYSLTTGVVGWWGLISMFATPIVLLNNVIRYSLSLSMPAGGLCRKDVIETTLPRLQRHTELIQADLERGRDLADIAKELAAKEGIPAEHIQFTLTAMIAAAQRPS